jgi:hypothetical protein
MSEKNGGMALRETSAVCNGSKKAQNPRGGDARTHSHKHADAFALTAGAIGSIVQTSRLG